MNPGLSRTIPARWRLPRMRAVRGALADAAGATPLAGYRVALPATSAAEEALATVLAVAVVALGADTVVLTGPSRASRRRATDRRDTLLVAPLAGSRPGAVAPARVAGVAVRDPGAAGFDVPHDVPVVHAVPHRIRRLLDAADLRQRGLLHILLPTDLQPSGRIVAVLGASARARALAGSCAAFGMRPTVVTRDAGDALEAHLEGVAVASRPPRDAQIVVPVDPDCTAMLDEVGGDAVVAVVDPRSAAAVDDALGVRSARRPVREGVVEYLREDGRRILRSRVEHPDAGAVVDTTVLDLEAALVVRALIHLTRSPPAGVAELPAGEVRAVVSHLLSAHGSARW